MRLRKKAQTVQTYYFDRYNGIEHQVDEQGAELPSRELARQHAQLALKDLVNREMPDGTRRDFIVDLRDQSGMLIYTCRMTFAGRWVEGAVPPQRNRSPLLGG